jgi:hypothetical protein
MDVRGVRFIFIPPLWKRAPAFDREPWTSISGSRQPGIHADQRVDRLNCGVVHAVHGIVCKLRKRSRYAKGPGSHLHGFLAHVTFAICTEVFAEDCGLGNNKTAEEHSAKA